MTPYEIIQILSGTIGTLGFGILFNARGKLLWAMAGGGFLSYTLYVLFYNFTQNEPVIYFVVAVLIALYSEIMARVLKTPATPIVTTALIPLIPGASLYNTMVSAFNASTDVFLSKALYTAQLALAFAFGIIIVTILSHFIFKRKQKQ